MIKRQPLFKIYSCRNKTRPKKYGPKKNMWEVSVPEGDSTELQARVTEAGADASDTDVYSPKEINQEPADEVETQPGQDRPVKYMWEVPVAEGDSTEQAQASSVVEAGADASHTDVYSHKEIKQEPSDRESDDEEETKPGQDRPVEGEVFHQFYLVEIKEEAPGELYPEHVKPEEIVIEPDVLQPDGLTAHDTSETSTTVRSCPRCHQYLWPHACGTRHRCKRGAREMHAKSPAGRRRVKNKRKEKYICDICTKSFIRRASVVRHLRFHSGQKPFYCKLCKKQFSLKQHLIAHERSHSERQQFHCKICENQFSQKKHLTLHERTHRKKKSFHCNICKKEFPRNNQLTVHERTHTKEKPFLCKICNKSFSCKSNLTVHERSHTGEKPFHCKICKKSFSCKSNLIGHERTHAGETPFHCKLCKKKFSRKDRLAAHELKHAGK